MSVLLGVYCSADSLSGGIEIGNPSVVTGCIVDMAGGPVPGARVFMVENDFNPVTGTVEYQSVTDERGRYSVTVSGNRTYSLNSVHSATGRRMRVNDIEVVGNENLERELDTLFEPGTLTVNVHDTGYESGLTLYIPGTDLYLPVSGPGSYSIAAPEGQVDIKSFNRDKGAVSEKGPRFMFLEVESGKETVARHSVPAPIKPLGKSSAAAAVEQVYTISTFTSNIGQPLEYRFAWVHYVDTVADYWAGATVGIWGTDTTSVRVWPHAGVFKIRAQARSSIDTSIVSQWSPYLHINVTE